MPADDGKKRRITSEDCAEVGPQTGPQTGPRRLSEFTATWYALASGNHYGSLFEVRRFGTLGDVGISGWASFRSLLDEKEK
jgi:hypothetical protein